MSNYPPGAKNDPRAPYNQPDRSHEHIWIGYENEPVFEDGAAIFHEYCDYAEGRYGEGWSCEKIRHTRFEATKVHVDGSPTHNLPNVMQEPDGAYEEVLLNLFDDVMQAARSGDGEFVSCDPDPDYGELLYRYDGITVTFQPD